LSQFVSNLKDTSTNEFFSEKQMAIALVTGGSRGIGRATALLLAQEGYTVAVNYQQNLHAAQEVMNLITQAGGKAFVLQADISDENQVVAMFTAIDQHDEPLAALVNNAGIQHVAPVEQFPVEKWNAILAINLSSVFHTSRLALPGMKERNWGRIINIASVHGLVASKEKSAYVAAKHAVVGLTKVIALENAQTNITCNALCPGWVLTPLVQQQIDQRIASGIAPDVARDSLLGEKQPSGEFVTPEQLGALALFLCSDAASQVRGAAWNMDGGWVAQ